MSRLIYTLLFVVIVLVACDEDEPPGPTEIKLHHYTESFDIPELGFQPQLTVIYDYDDSGNLEKYTFFGYDPDSDTMVEHRSFVFSYLDRRVDKIEGFSANTSTPYIKYTYRYLQDSRVEKIIENNYAAGLDSEANFAYLPGDIIKVSYQYSNGASFEYEFDYGDGNILTDKTTRGPQLCSDGMYTYDQRKNPFRTLGYVDYVLLNLSANNKLTESVNYMACSFPSSIPESFEYEYDSNDFPTVSTTHYRPDGTVKKSHKKFFYKNVKVRE